MPRRLRRLRRLADEHGAAVYVAASPLARLLGLAGLREMPPRSALLVTRCSCVHTFGMRFPIDVLFLDDHCDVVAERRGVRPGRVVRHRGAAAALEFPAAAAQAGEPTSPARR